MTKGIKYTKEGLVNISEKSLRENMLKLSQEGLRESKSRIKSENRALYSLLGNLTTIGNKRFLSKLQETRLQFIVAAIYESMDHPIENKDGIELPKVEGKLALDTLIDITNGGREKVDSIIRRLNSENHYISQLVCNYNPSDIKSQISENERDYMKFVVACMYNCLKKQARLDKRRQNAKVT